MALFNYEDFSARDSELARIQAVLSKFEATKKREIVDEIVETARANFRSSGEMRGYVSVTDDVGLDTLRLSIGNSEENQQLTQIITAWMHEVDPTYEVKVITGFYTGEREYNSSGSDPSTLSIHVNFTPTEQSSSPETYQEQHQRELEESMQLRRDGGTTGSPYLDDLYDLMDGSNDIYWPDTQT